MERGKKAAGIAASKIIEDGMVVGLGTGSTVFYFFQALIKRVQEGLKIQVVSSSKQSERLAREGNLPFAEIERTERVDLTVDGADELSREKWLIKGGGGALLREKILATMSKEMVVIVDASKVVERLGVHPLPLEILPFASRATLYRIEKLGYRGKLRKDASGKPFLTDNGNYIYDIHFDSPLSEPERDQAILSQIPGVLETGFFFHLAGRVFVGKEDGSVENWP